MAFEPLTRMASPGSTSGRLVRPARRRVAAWMPRRSYGRASRRWCRHLPYCVDDSNVGIDEKWRQSTVKILGGRAQLAHVAQNARRGVSPAPRPSVAIAAPTEDGVGVEPVVEQHGLAARGPQAHAPAAPLRRRPRLRAPPPLARRPSRRPRAPPARRARCWRRAARDRRARTRTSLAEDVGIGVAVRVERGEASRRRRRRR